ncbi:hypothetical protein LD39_00825 [Halobacillus sp. BBL2006]|nr:hypothetical protein LD39_00825 [Halobacillus sp. BBL2006]
MQEYLTEIKRYQKAIDRVPDQMRVKLIELKSKQLYFIGELAAEFAGQYKEIYAARKQIYNEAYLEAEKYKQQKAELAVIELRKTEADYFRSWKRWQNATETVREEINSLKYRVRQDIADGNRQG